MTAVPRSRVARSSFKTVPEKGTVPFCSEDSAKSGQSPTVLKLLLVEIDLFTIAGADFKQALGELGYLVDCTSDRTAGLTLTGIVA